MTVIHKKIYFLLRVIVTVTVLVFPIFIVLAQDGSSAPQVEMSTSSVVVATTTSGATESRIASPATTTRPAGSVTSPGSASPNPVHATSVPTPQAATDTAGPINEPAVSVEEQSSNSSFWIGLVSLAVFTAGYGVVRSVRKKKTEKKENEKDRSRCFDIKQMMGEKMKELTDLKGQLESKIKEQAREKVREEIDGTRAGEILRLIEEGEAAYEKLKQLYEKCIIEVSAGGKQAITACAFIHRKFDGVEKVFLAKRANIKKFLPGVYELPGGHIEFGEDMGAGLKREIHEEFGMAVKVGNPFAAFTYLNDSKNTHSVEVIYFAEFTDPIGNIRINPRDHSAFGWFAENEIHKAASESKPESDLEFEAIRRGFVLLKG